MQLSHRYQQIRLLVKKYAASSSESGRAPLLKYLRFRSRHKEHTRKQEKHHVFAQSGDPQGISVRVRLKLKQWPNEKERSSRGGHRSHKFKFKILFGTLTFSVKPKLPFCNACSFDHKHYTRYNYACAKDTVLKRDSRSCRTIYLN